VKLEKHLARGREHFHYHYYGKRERKDDLLGITVLHSRGGSKRSFSITGKGKWTISERKKCLTEKKNAFLRGRREPKGKKGESSWEETRA